MKVSPNKTKKIDIRITDEMYESLDFYAKSYGMKVSQLIRLYIDFMLTNLEKQERSINDNQLPN